MKKTILLATVIFTVLLSKAQSYNYEQGVKAFEQNEVEMALDYFSRDLSDNPKNAMSYLYRSIIYYYQDNFAFALRNINNSIKYFPKKSKRLLASAYQLRGDIYYEIEEFDKTFKDYATAIKLTPDDIDLYIDRAQMYYDLEQYDKAELDYLKALEIDESSLVAQAGLGKNYIDQKKFKKAEETLNKLIRLSSDYSGGYYYRAQLYYEQEKFDDAINDMFHAYVLDESFRLARIFFIYYANKNYPLALSKVNIQINMQPQNDKWYFIRAQILENKEDYKAAISDYSKLIEMQDTESNKALLLYYRAQCYSNAGMHKASISDLDAAISLDSTDAYYYGYRGDAKRLLGDYESAVEDFTKAIELEPRVSWFYYRRGWTEGEFMGNYEAALEDYNSAISINKESAYTYLMRGRLLESKFNNPEKAREDYQKILELDTIVDNQGNVRQYALFHLGRDEEAIEWQNKILEQYPTSGNYYDAACLYSLMNKPDQAISNMELAFKNGYRDFVHLLADDDLDNIHDLQEFKDLVEKWQESFRKDTDKKQVYKPFKHVDYDTITIPMNVKSSGIYEISSKINGLPLNLIFDTGASDITISQTEVQFMLKNGYLQESDVIGSQKYMDANGDIEVGTTIVFREVDLGGVTLKNVKASVIHNKNAPLLFGQSALNKYGKITIDNEKKTITIITK